MAVVTHGSIDEGPIVLALPPEFIGLLPEGIQTETDPLFTAWDRSTGIVISKNQIVDRSDIITTDGANGTTNISSIVTGTNTGDQDISGKVPYTGAVSDVTLGVHNLSANKVTITGTPLVSTDAITKGYFDSNQTTGITWLKSVLDIVSTLPGGATLGDRYIHSTDNKINEWNGSSWTATSPTSGNTLFVAGDSAAPTNSIGNYTWNGSAWVYVGSSMNHNDLANIQGGAPGNYYHLDSATVAVVPNVLTDTAPDVVTGLTISSHGISTSATGYVSAYVVLTWNASGSSNFGHYHILYRNTASSTWVGIDVYTDTTTRIEGLYPNTPYEFKIAAVSRSSKSSAYSSVASLTTDLNTTPPLTVNIIAATGGIQCILLEFSYNSESDVASYNIYRNTSNNSAGASLRANTKNSRFTDLPLSVSTTYYYWVKAVNSSGYESTNFSSVMYATTQQIQKEDIFSISADKVLITGATYLSSWSGTGDSTKINGAQIDTGSITTGSLSFSPVLEGNIIAKINASPENGLVISSSKIALVGSTTLTSDPNAVSKVQIYPTENQNLAMLVTDDLAQSIFQVNIGGPDAGDVIIGNWDNSQGIKYDHSAGAHGTTYFSGTVNAADGNIGGWEIDADGIFVGTKQTSDGYSTNGITLAGAGGIHSKNFYINTDGSSSIAGNLPHVIRKGASNNLRHSHDAVVSVSSPSYATTGMAKAIVLTNGLLGTVRVSFDLAKHTYGGSDIGTARLYLNGSTLSAYERTATGTDSYNTFIEDITHDFLPGDHLELRINGTSGTTVFVRNFRISYDDNPIVAVASTNI